MAPVSVKPDKIREFESEAAFETWLQANHDREDEVWIKIHKKGSGLKSVTSIEAIDVVLCWGWIDGIRKAFDDKSFLQRYTPRGRKSIWSQVNRDNVARLTKAGRMQPSGQAHIDAARADGRWDAAYASGKDMKAPPDLLAAIEAEPEALETYLTLNAQNRFALSFRTHNMKTEAGRKKKIESFVVMLKEGKTPYPQTARKKAAE
jgi:uncharacterized protein YdeI (YjbR/CyaY-like superfamily)